MVANTGLRIETRVIHMAGLPGGAAQPSEFVPRLGAGVGVTTTRRLHDDRRALLQVVEAGGQHRDPGRERGPDLDAARLLVAPAERHHAPRELALVDGPDIALAGLRAHGPEGTLGAGALAASAMRPLANIPLRSAASALGSAT